MPGAWSRAAASTRGAVRRGPLCQGPHGRPGPGMRRGRLRDMDGGLRVQQGGSGEPVLLLLHGLGATGDVWDGWRPLLARRWPGRWLAPDLPGHGGSRPLLDYTFDTMAAAVADIASGGGRTVVLGHSLGGVVGLVLASGGFPVPVHAAIGLGIKVAWTREELDRARAGRGAPADGLVRLARGGCRPLPAHLGSGRPGGRRRPRCECGPAGGARPVAASHGSGRVRRRGTRHGAAAGTIAGPGDPGPR